ncbi:unnamed protein product [Phytomonas sp. EM1]|nr:unnamed protein product [Phytomonas sp. EM1]|eukprot:CCW60531.1 unnamed protein product [Phytomonas sp. isolate EM1]
MSLLKLLEPQAPPLRENQMIAFDYIDNNNEWRWSLGTILKIDKHSATLQRWDTLGNNDTLKSIILKELERETKMLDTFRGNLCVARDTLAAIRSANEDHVSQVRVDYDQARINVENISEVDLRNMISKAVPTPIAMAVLRGAMAVAKCDPYIDEFYDWTDIQIEYRKKRMFPGVKVDIIAKKYPYAKILRQRFLLDPHYSLDAAKRDSFVTGALHEWITTALAYQEAYNNLTEDGRIQAQNNAIAASIAGIRASRAKIATLKKELSTTLHNTFPKQVTSFTKTSISTTIPLSAVICPIGADSSMEGCALTNDEVHAILSEAKRDRYSLNFQLNSVADSLVETLAELHTLSIYMTDLEERRLSLQEHYFLLIQGYGSNTIDSKGHINTEKEVSKLEPIESEYNRVCHESHDETQPMVSSSHQNFFHGIDWRLILSENQEEFLLAFIKDASAACSLSTETLHNISFSFRHDGLLVACDVTHPAWMSCDYVDTCLARASWKNILTLRASQNISESTLASIIAETRCDLRLNESGFPKIAPPRSSTEAYSDSSCVTQGPREGKISDILIPSHSMKNENTSLKYILENSSSQLKAQLEMLVIERDNLKARNEELIHEVQKFRNLIESPNNVSNNQNIERKLWSDQQMHEQRDVELYIQSRAANLSYSEINDKQAHQKEPLKAADKDGNDLMTILLEKQKKLDQVECDLKRTTEELHRANTYTYSLERGKSKSLSEETANRREWQLAKEIIMLNGQLMIEEEDSSKKKNACIK